MWDLYVSKGNREEQLTHSLGVNQLIGICLNMERIIVELLHRKATRHKNFAPKKKNLKKNNT